MSRLGFQGIGSPAIPNTVSMMSSGMVGIPNTGNINSGRGASHVNSTLRPPREAVQHMMRAAQGNSQEIPAFGSLSYGFTNNQTTSVQSYPGHVSQLQSPSPSHATGAQQDVFALRQRQMHQRYMQQQQQQQFAAFGTIMPHGQQKPQGTSVSSSPQKKSSDSTTCFAPAYTDAPSVYLS